MLGFEEVAAHQDRRLNNRVIMITDGIANVGVTDPTTIAEEAKRFNDQGIYLSSVGLGPNFNDTLLNTLATQGHGAYHYLDSAAEIEKVFQSDVTGLFQKAAAEVSITIQPATGVTVRSLTGYDGTPPAGPVEVRLRDMGTGDGQVVLAELDVAGGGEGGRRLADVTLHYQDLLIQKTVSQDAVAMVDATPLRNYDPLHDTEVLRNVTIQSSALGLQEIDRLYQRQRYSEAWKTARRLETQLTAVQRLTGDEQIQKDVDLMRRYQDTLARYVEDQTGRSPNSEPDPGDADFPSGRRGAPPSGTAEPAVLDIR